MLFDPAVLTHVNYPKSLKLETSPAGSRSAQQLVAQADGAFDIEVQYQLQITRRDTDSGFVLPVPGGLVNRVTLSLVNLDVDVFLAAGRVGAARRQRHQHRGDARACARRRVDRVEAAQPRREK